MLRATCIPLQPGNVGALMRARQADVADGFGTRLSRMGRTHVGSRMAEGHGRQYKRFFIVLSNL